MEYPKALLKNTTVNNECLTVIPKGEALPVLESCETGLSKEDIAKIGELPRVRSFSIDNTKILREKTPEEVRTIKDRAAKDWEAQKNAPKREPQEIELTDERLKALKEKRGEKFKGEREHGVAQSRDNDEKLLGPVVRGTTDMGATELEIRRLIGQASDTIILPPKEGHGLPNTRNSDKSDSRNR